MRLMLGTQEHPSLLVEVEREYSPTHFEFWVVNGAWQGTYTNGYVTVGHPYEPWTELDKTEILCDNQDRLRGHYNDVFCNFHNPDYVAPKSDIYWPELPAEWDDDIPF